MIQHEPSTKKPRVDGDWRCVCGFNNRPQNTMCGGNGNMGCKMPKDQARAAAALGAGGRVAWKCMCGFENRAHNDVCGGRAGSMGCKAPRMMALSAMGGAAAAGRGGMGMSNMGGPMGNMMGMMGGMGGMGQSMMPVSTIPGGWVCMVCGFQNRPQNKICGGDGPMGCNTSKHQGSFGMMGGSVDRSWVCSCGFKNRPQNTKCGGNGTMGCNLPAPAPWVCPACNFKNNPKNTICGGKGKLGCNATKETGDEWVCSKDGCGFKNQPSLTNCAVCRAMRPDAEGAAGADPSASVTPIDETITE